MVRVRDQKKTKKLLNRAHPRHIPTKRAPPGRDNQVKRVRGKEQDRSESNEAVMGKDEKGVRLLQNAPFQVEIRRVLQEKEKLKKELNQMKSMHVYYEEKYQELISKYESTMKDKMTLKVEKERHLVKIKALEESIGSLQNKLKNALVENSEKNYDNSAMNESFSVNNTKKSRLNKKTKTLGKENQSSSHENESLKKTLGITKNKTNPLLTPIPQELQNTFLHPSTGMVVEIKPIIGINLSPVKKIKVSLIVYYWIVKQK